MSMTALLKGAEAYLKSQTGDIRELRFGVMPDGKPDPKMGKWYCSIYPIGKTQVPTRNDGAKKAERFTFACSLTVKFNAPRDRQGAAITMDDIGIMDIAERFENYVHGSYDLITQSTAFLDDPTSGPFAEPMIWSGTSYSLKDSSWVWSTIETTAPIIYVADMRFFGGLRVRPIR